MTIPRDAQKNAAMERIAASMVNLEAGKITLKQERTGRRWFVDLLPFRISKFVVVQGDYLLLTQGGEVDANNRRKPMVDVSWLEAIQFCNLLSREAGLLECYSWDSTGEVICDWTSGGYRLPSEAEWEFACRAGSRQVTYGELNDIAWYRDNASEELHDVGTLAPNDWGLYDMIGNVWEWCWDIFDAEVYGEYRVFRGGGWNDLPRSCRASCRRKSHPSFRVDDLGFRVAQSVPMLTHEHAFHDRTNSQA
jgi:formylglycine-generating enzyme